MPTLILSAESALWVGVGIEEVPEAEVDVDDDDDEVEVDEEEEDIVVEVDEFVPWQDADDWSPESKQDIASESCPCMYRLQVGTRYDPSARPFGDV